MSLPAIPAQRTAEVFDSSTGPAPHEVLTIAETLRSMSDPSQKRPGEQCFVTGTNQQHWMSDKLVDKFIAEFGALHPADYRSIHGSSWERRFFIGF